MSDRLIVAGFHRSGTSLVCQLLQRAGLFLGYDLLGANFSNRHGHFEDVEVLNLHKQILGDNGYTWMVDRLFLPVITEPHWQAAKQIIQKRDAEHGLWGFKDPRVCLFLMFWKHLLPNAKVLLVYRHFSDSTYSLAQRHSAELFSNEGPYPRQMHRRLWEEPDLGLRMWLTYNDALLTFAHAYPEDTLALSSHMVQGGFPVVRAINQRWGLGLDEEVALSEVFDPSLIVRRPGKQPVSDRGLIERTDATWQALEGLSKQTQRTMEEAKVVER